MSHGSAVLGHPLVGAKAGPGPRRPLHCGARSGATSKDRSNWSPLEKRDYIYIYIKNRLENYFTSSDPHHDISI